MRRLGREGAGTAMAIRSTKQRALPRRVGQSLHAAQIAEFLNALALHLAAVDIPLGIDADEVEVVEFAELMADAAV